MLERQMPPHNSRHFQSTLDLHATSERQREQACCQSLLQNTEPKSRSQVVFSAQVVCAAPHQMHLSYSSDIHFPQS